MRSYTFKLAKYGDQDVKGECIMADNVILPGEFNPHNVRLWVIGNEFGAMGAVWADHEGDALDALVDAGLGAGILVDAADEDEDSAHLGNAGEPADLTYCWMEAVDLGRQSVAFLCALAEARGGACANLDLV